MENMRNSNEDNIHEAKRPVDALAADTYSWWGRNMVLMLKSKVKSWKFVFSVAFFAGIIIAIIWMISV